MRVHVHSKWEAHMKPRTLCPTCKGKDDRCAMCEGKGYVAPHVASAWFAAHPEARRATTDETPVEEDDQAEADEDVNVA